MPEGRQEITEAVRALAWPWYIAEITAIAWRVIIAQDTRKDEDGFNLDLSEDEDGLILGALQDHEFIVYDRKAALVCFLSHSEDEARDLALASRSRLPSYSEVAEWCMLLDVRERIGRILASSEPPPEGYSWQPTPGGGRILVRNGEE